MVFLISSNEKRFRLILIASLKATIDVMVNRNLAREIPDVVEGGNERTAVFLVDAMRYE